MNLPSKTMRLLGTLLMSACLLMLFAYWLMPGPYWKYGSYPFLCFVGTFGLFVALTDSNLRRWLGCLVLAVSILLGYATFDSRKNHDEMRARLRKEAESRMLEELKNEASPASKEGGR